MKRTVILLMLVVSMACAQAAYAEEDSKCDCDCKKGGLGLMLAGFVVGFGVRTFNTTLGCDKSVGVGMGIGSDQHQVRIGAGYNEGVLSIGLIFRGPEKTTAAGFGIGWDYSDCRMVWPYEE